MRKQRILVYVLMTILTLLVAGGWIVRGCTMMVEDARPTPTATTAPAA